MAQSEGIDRHGKEAGLYAKKEETLTTLRNQQCE
jgi:hypothetical protein